VIRNTSINKKSMLNSPSKKTEKSLSSPFKKDLKLSFCLKRKAKGAEQISFSTEKELRSSPPEN
jgi:hypothetical protein